MALAVISDKSKQENILFHGFFRKVTEMHSPQCLVQKHDPYSKNNVHTANHHGTKYNFKCSNSAYEYHIMLIPNNVFLLRVHRKNNGTLWNGSNLSGRQDRRDSVQRMARVTPNSWSLIKC